MHTATASRTENVSGPDRLHRSFPNHTSSENDKSLRTTFSLNVVSKPRMLSVRTVYVLGSLHHGDSAGDTIFEAAAR
jgi:hypothetical protein